MANAAEHLTATNLEEAALLMRAAAAYSTALKNTSDTLRHSMGTGRALKTVEAESLPELVVQEISGTEALRMTENSEGHMSKSKELNTSLKKVGGGLDDDVTEEMDKA